MNSKSIFPILFFLFLTVSLFSQIPDYSLLTYWAAHGEKADYADSIPTPLKKKTSSEVLAHVFFIHPTTYTEGILNGAKDWNAKIDDRELNKKTDESSIKFQASAFNNGTVVFAPRYRQAHIKSFHNSGTLGKNALDTAYADVRAGFLYYLEKWNKGMPIIIASHSQGTVHAGKLIKEFFENKVLEKQLVAAYLIGMPVKKDYFEKCRPCQNKDDINCFVSWRCYLKGIEGEGYIQREASNSVYVTNPLNWALGDTAVIDRKENKGAVFYKFNTLLKKVSGAQVYNNILWVTKPRFPGSFLMKNNLTNYHIADINLFYVNIRENVLERIQAYLKKRK